MKIFLIAVATTLSLIAPTFIQADEGYYVGGQGGVNFLYSDKLQSCHCSFDTGYNLGGVAGYAWCNGLQAEAEVTYHDNDYSIHGRNIDGEKADFHGNVNTWSCMANGYYQLPFTSFSQVTPYVGGGLGCDRVHQRIKIEGERFKGSRTGFSWQLMAGANFSLCKDIVLSAEYKFHVSPLRNNNHLQNHSVTIGVKKFFDLCFW